MRKPQVDDYVRLTTSIPELSLSCGQVGVVRSLWFSPIIAYEVEFHPVGYESQTRALLLSEQILVNDEPMLAAT